MRWFVDNLLSRAAIASLQGFALLCVWLSLGAHAQDEVSAGKPQPARSVPQQPVRGASPQPPVQSSTETPLQPKAGKADGPEWGAKLPTATARDSAAQAQPHKAPDGGAPEKQTPMNIPLVEGSPGLFLRIPDLDAEGKLRSLFVIGEVAKVDDRTVEIKDSFFETYRDDLSRDFSIDLPKAHLDIYSKVLIAKVPVTIWRQEFELRGATMEFDTTTREGGLGGPVEMIIYNGFGGAAEPAQTQAKPSSGSAAPRHTVNPAAEPPKPQR